MTKKLLINPENPEGTLVNFTAEEIAQNETDEANSPTDAVTRIEAEQVIKASAKTKLIAGEALTEDEANTIVL
mgnify:CR=1 FL=1|tara:strand:+ start:1287 stop:1505 length:219 start_codon:yes stop_codon:yes gene_type:complete